MKARAVLLAMLLGFAAPSQAADTALAAASDVLDRPARVSPLAARRLLLGVAAAGERLVAVGPRGHIVVSSDGGANWKQAAAPVSSDLTAVYFVDARNGWAVGHDGVVLASSDGGDTWQRQLDGRRINALLLDHMQARAAAEPASAEVKALLQEAERFVEQGPDKPLLNVWFADAQHGYVVGAYNLILETGDGGRSWTPWFDRTDNPKLLNLYSIRPAAGGLYVAGEGGLVLKLDAAARRFRSVPVDYKGSLFGVVDGGDAALVFGLRGNLFRSDDGGRQWTRIDSRLPATIVAGMRRGDSIVLADQGGRIAASRDGGRSFSRIELPRTVPVTSIAAAGDRLALATPGGVLLVDPAAGR